MEIKKLENKDIDFVVNLWYKTSIKAHDFIPKDYWLQNKEKMSKTYLPNSETYIALIDGKIVGFISMIGNFLAAIYIDTEKQRKGIGKKLLNFIKEKREIIQLKVYKENKNSVNFYKKQGFFIISEKLEENTNEVELLMEWNN